jgi:hypothetical protein
MRDVGVQGRASLKPTEVRLRRRPISQVLEQPQSAGRQGADLTHLIGLGILLSAALLIAIGSFAGSKRANNAGPTSAASAFADARGPRH